MEPRSVKLLHVEDDTFQQRLIAAQLATLPEFRFDITCADSEPDAVRTFEQGGFELVLLDYHLSQGNGLSCLRQLRERDVIVPIVALSGLATPDVAAQLLQVGADDFLGKQDLEPETLGRSIREAISRADAWRKHAPDDPAARVGRSAQLFEELCSSFVAATGPAFVQRLADFEAAARQANLGVGQMRGMFDTITAKLKMASPDAAPTVKPALRPLLLEILFRLFESDSGPGAQA